MFEDIRINTPYWTRLLLAHRADFNRSVCFCETWLRKGGVIIAGDNAHLTRHTNGSVIDHTFDHYIWNKAEFSFRLKPLYPFLKGNGENRRWWRDACRCALNPSLTSNDL